MADAKRVLFVERNLRNEKLGIMYLSAALKARGHHADLIQTDKENLDDRIRDDRPNFVAFSITTGEHIFALKTAGAVKKRYGIPNIFGGPHCTYFPEIGFAPEVDFVVQGQGEGVSASCSTHRTSTQRPRTRSGAVHGDSRLQSPIPAQFHPPAATPGPIFPRVPVCHESPYPDRVW